ncbi:hypothetical protein V8C86DRAFT_2571984 [Haematococcus lacustris]
MAAFRAGCRVAAAAEAGARSRAGPGPGLGPGPGPWAGVGAGATSGFDLFLGQEQQLVRAGEELLQVMKALSSSQLQHAELGNTSHAVAWLPWLPLPAALGIMAAARHLLQPLPVVHAGHGLKLDAVARLHASAAVAGAWLASAAHPHPHTHSQLQHLHLAPLGPPASTELERAAAGVRTTPWPQWLPQPLAFSLLEHLLSLNGPQWQRLHQAAAQLQLALPPALGLLALQSLGHHVPDAGGRAGKPAQPAHTKLQTLAMQSLAAQDGGGDAASVFGAEVGHCSSRAGRQTLRSLSHSPAHKDIFPLCGHQGRQQHDAQQAVVALKSLWQHQRLQQRRFQSKPQVTPAGGMGWDTLVTPADRGGTEVRYSTSRAPSPNALLLLQRLCASLQHLPRKSLLDCLALVGDMFPLLPRHKQSNRGVSDTLWQLTPLHIEHQLCGHDIGSTAEARGCEGAVLQAPCAHFGPVPRIVRAAVRKLQAAQTCSAKVSCASHDEVQAAAAKLYKEAERVAVRNVADRERTKGLETNFDARTRRLAVEYAASLLRAGHRCHNLLLVCMQAEAQLIEAKHIQAGRDIATKGQVPGSLGNLSRTKFSGYPHLDATSLAGKVGDGSSA